MSSVTRRGTTPGAGRVLSTVVRPAKHPAPVVARRPRRRAAHRPGRLRGTGRRVVRGLRGPGRRRARRGRRRGPGSSPTESVDRRTRPHAHRGGPRSAAVRLGRRRGPHRARPLAPRPPGAAGGRRPTPPARPARAQRSAAFAERTVSSCSSASRPGAPRGPGGRADSGRRGGGSTRPVPGSRTSPVLPRPGTPGAPEQRCRRCVAHLPTARPSGSRSAPGDPRPRTGPGRARTGDDVCAIGTEECESAS